MYTKDKEGPLHRSIRIWRNRYKVMLSICCVMAVVMVATTITIATQTVSGASANNETAEDENNTTTLMSPLAFASQPSAGVCRVLYNHVAYCLREAEVMNRAKLLKFDEDSDWARESFAEFVKNFKHWCYTTTQLTIDMEHTYTIHDTVSQLAKITNTVNTEAQTGALSVLKPTYGQRMYYDYGNVDYYVAMVGDATRTSTPWIHVSRDSDRDVLRFCQDSVITTTAVNTVEEILSEVAKTGAYRTKDGVRDNFYVSWCGNIDNTLLTPTFALMNDQRVTRVDVQCCSDVVYCIVTYLYEDSDIGVSEEMFKYTFKVSDQVISSEIPKRVTEKAKDSTKVITNILEEI